VGVLVIDFFARNVTTDEHRLFSNQHE